MHSTRPRRPTWRERMGESSTSIDGSPAPLSSSCFPCWLRWPSTSTKNCTRTVAFGIRHSASSITRHHFEIPQKELLEAGSSRAASSTWKTGHPTLVLCLSTSSSFFQCKDMHSAHGDVHVLMCKTSTYRHSPHVLMPCVSLPISVVVVDFASAVLLKPVSHFDTSVGLYILKAKARLYLITTLQL